MHVFNFVFILKKSQLIHNYAVRNGREHKIAYVAFIHLMRTHTHRQRKREMCSYERANKRENHEKESMFVSGNQINVCVDIQFIVELITVIRYEV